MAGFHGQHIEPSAFRKGCYTALCVNGRFHIRRGVVEGWVAQEQIPNSPEIMPNGRRFYARTLRQLDNLMIEAAKADKKIFG